MVTGTVMKAKRGVGALVGQGVGTLRSYPPYLSRAYVKSFSLRPVANRTRNLARSDIVLVSCQRNELARLPHFFDHYRRLGVRHFLFVDNDSDDGSREWLSRQPDCSVWRTTASYRRANFGMDWCNALLRRYGGGRWCVTVDPDEFLVYPRMETRSLRALCQFLDDEGRRSFHALMIDAYSDRALSQTEYAIGDNPFAVCPFFDRDGYSQRAGWGRSTYIQGGPRMRAYYAELPEKAPALNKIPLIKWRWYYYYRSSMHDCRPLYLNNPQHRSEAPPTGCLFHFKFMSSLSAKVAEEMRRQQHYAGSAEYKRYGSVDDLTLFRDGLSVRYESPRQLVDLGLMNEGEWF